MKGIIFTEFLEMVEEKFGLEVADQILENTSLESGGIYTAVGTYDFNEMVSLLTALSQTVEMDPGSLLFAFGHYLFGGLGKAHPEVIASYKDPLELIYGIEDHIHVQVRKLYPEAQLPTFTILDRNPDHLTLVYQSERGLYAIAHGLMESCFQHFDQHAQVTYKLLEPNGTKVEFQIVRNG